MKVALLQEGKAITADDIEFLKKEVGGFSADGCSTIGDPKRLISTLQSVLSIIEEQDRGTLKNEAASSGVKSTWCGPDVPPDEAKMTGMLNELSDRWIKYLQNSPKFKGNANLFNMDGFYPYYLQQKVKILFVGREACCMSGRNYIERVMGEIKKDDLAGWSVNRYPFNRRQCYIAYGILARAKTGKFPDWDNVPWASDMASKKNGGHGIFASIDGTAINIEGTATNEKMDSISWSFMNLSKLSNESGDFRTDSARYLPFVSDSGNQEFIREEIRILKPDVIIGANVPELEKMLGYDAPDCTNPNCSYYEKTKSFPPFLNCYHFAAIKSDKKCFYEPVRDVLNTKNRMDELCSSGKSSMCNGSR